MTPSVRNKRKWRKMKEKGLQRRVNKKALMKRTKIRIRLRVIYIRCIG
jgi:hypothetical protein